MFTKQKDYGLRTTEREKKGSVGISPIIRYGQLISRCSDLQ